MENQAQLADLLSEHASWQNQILHFKGDLRSMKDELGMVVAKYPPREVPASAEHFQNQFILQKDVLDIMRHDFKQYENKVEDAQRNNVSATDYLLLLRNAYRVRLSDFEKIYHELKNDFDSFKKHESVPTL